MNWLIAVLERIDSKREVDSTARERLKQVAGELSGICDQRIPHAPTLMYEVFRDEIESTGDHDVWCGSLGWFWVAKQRTLHVQAARADHPVLVMLDGAVATYKTFDHCRLKTSVFAFFEGWTPEQHLVFATSKP